MFQLGFALFALFLAAPAAAQNRCTAPDGRVTFQDAPCPSGAAAQPVRIRSHNVMESPAPLPMTDADERADRARLRAAQRADDMRPLYKGRAPQGGAVGIGPCVDPRVLRNLEVDRAAAAAARDRAASWRINLQILEAQRCR